MKTTNENPPAFPRPGISSNWAEGHLAHEGMTLRDWFAGQALAGILAQDSERQQGRYELANKFNTTPTPLTAKEAYQHADAMLAQRSKSPTP